MPVLLFALALRLVLVLPIAPLCSTITSSSFQSTTYERSLDHGRFDAVLICHLVCACTIACNNTAAGAAAERSSFVLVIKQVDSLVVSDRFIGVDIVHSHHYITLHCVTQIDRCWRLA
jgi:hypothetical protein